MSDPFRHHPGLEGKIADPETSFFRDFSIAKLEKVADEHGMPKGWWFTDDEREARRIEILKDRRGRDFWVFGYGSLMWDPAIRFTEVRRAHVADYERRFILVDTKGGRGGIESPGLFAALDRGDGCDGIAFRIAAEEMETETRILWQREMIAPGYLPVFVEATTVGGTIDAVAFVADHASDDIEPDLPRERQVEYLATGTGFLGTSFGYLEGIVEKLDELGIKDAHLRDLHAEVRARREALGLEV